MRKYNIKNVGYKWQGFVLKTITNKPNSKIDCIILKSPFGNNPKFNNLKVGTCIIDQDISAFAPIKTKADLFIEML